MSCSDLAALNRLLASFNCNTVVTRLPTTLNEQFPEIHARVLHPACNKPVCRLNLPNTSGAFMSLAQAAPTRNAHEMHFAVAEYGKVMALQKNHTEALRHYREAIRMAVSIKAPEVFFRHYTQCVLESLELTGTYSDVIEFCENADRHYSALEVSRAVHKKTGPLF